MVENWEIMRKFAEHLFGFFISKPDNPNKSITRI